VKFAGRPVGSGAALELGTADDAAEDAKDEDNAED
jgi:hypothetical protein